jgi:putative ABC transport system permease protein
MSVLRRLFRFSGRSRKDIATDVRDEIAFHLEMRVRELVDHGWSRDAAVQEARRQFGDVNTTAAYCRRLDVEKEKGMRMRRYAGELWQDLSYGARMLHRQPGHSAVALLTIALGIGATTLVFSVVYASLLAPLPYAHPERLMVVRLSIPDYADVRASTDAFEDSGVFASNLYMLEDEQVRGGVVSGRFFATLGVPALIGRAVDDSDGSAPVVVLSYGLWQRRFGADPQIVGRKAVLSGTPHTIVGVMPARFQFPSRTFQLWAGMAFTMAQVPEQSQNRGLRIFQAVGRLRPAIAASEAQAQFSTLAQRLAAAHPTTNTGVPLTLVSVRDRLVGDVRMALLIALGSVGCLLFIAAANVASLALARMTTRTQELAVRAAIGAGRSRIARQLVTESLLIAVCGGALGVLLSWWGLAALPSLIGNRVPHVEEVALNLPVLLVSAIAILLSGLLVAIVPVVQLSMTQIEPALRGGSRGGGEMRVGHRLRSVLVVAQISLAVVVLSASLVLTRSLVRLLQVDPGFTPDRLLTFNLPLIGVSSPGARAATTARALDAVAVLPGIESVGGATGLAPVTAQRGTGFELEGRSESPVEERRGYFIAASPGYFKTLGTRLVAGREFAMSDTEQAPRVVIVSKTLAQRFFPDGDAVGRRLRLLNQEQSNEWRTIVGVVADVRYQGLDDSDPPAVYTPFAQTPFPWIYVHVRTHGNPANAIEPIRRTVKSVDARLAVANPQPMTALVTESSADPRFRTTLVSLFGAIAMLLAAVGLHGVVAFGVARRTREIAIRLALGASVRSVRWRVIRHSLALAVVGVGVGLLGALWAGRLLADLLYETTPRDAGALVTVAALLLVVAVVASAVPARRATRIQPVDALRDV